MKQVIKFKKVLIPLVMLIVFSPDVFAQIDGSFRPSYSFLPKNRMITEFPKLSFDPVPFTKPRENIDQEEINTFPKPKPIMDFFLSNLAAEEKTVFISG